MENATGFRLSIGKLLTLFPPIAIIILYVFAVTHPDLFVFLGGFASDEKKKKRFKKIMRRGGALEPNHQHQGQL